MLAKRNVSNPKNAPILSNKLIVLKSFLLRFDLTIKNILKATIKIPNIIKIKYRNGFIVFKNKDNI